MDALPFDRSVLLVIYLLLVVVDFVTMLVYWWAYNRMKRTPMILSVAILLTALLISDVYYMSYQWFLLYSDSHILAIPYFWAIPKLLVLGSLLFFLRMSFTVPKHSKKR